MMDAKNKIEPGKYRLRIVDVTPRQKCKNGKSDCVVFTYDVSGQDLQAKSRLALTDSTKTILKVMANSFDIPENEINPYDFSNWIGRYGAGTIINDNGGFDNAVDQFIYGNQKDNLPPWKDPFSVWDKQCLLITPVDKIPDWDETDTICQEEYESKKMTKKEFDDLFFSCISPDSTERDLTFPKYLIRHLLAATNKIKASDSRAFEMLKLLYEVYRDCDD